MTTSVAVSTSTNRLLTPEFWTLGTATAAYFLGVGVLNALLPRYVVDELGGTEATSGFVMGSMAISALLCRPWFGRLADRRGARVVLMIGACLACVSVLVLAAFPSLVGAVASRLVMGGAGGAMITGAMTLSMDIAPESRRSQAGSYILISFHVGLGIGPLLGEFVLGRSDYRSVWLAVGGLVLVSCAVSSFLPRRAGVHDDQMAPTPLVFRAAIAPGLVTLFGVFAFNGLLQFAPLYGREVGLKDVGLVFTVASLTIVVVRLFFGGVPDVVGPVRAGSWALVLTAFAATVVALWATPAGLYVGAALLACGLSLQSPSFMALAVEGVSDRERGAALATYTGFFDIANAIIGPAIGMIVVGFDYRVAFLTAGAMSLVALAILRLVIAPQRT
ncbi:MFS transporter [Ilumatobacter sp.]|uniref:MFS transporter n=1 Tax=Ilumatobacter sp. TaxID=1967498 RepID=UPI0037505F7E